MKNSGNESFAFFLVNGAGGKFFCESCNKTSPRGLEFHVDNWLAFLTRISDESEPIGSEITNGICCCDCGIKSVAKLTLQIAFRYWMGVNNPHCFEHFYE